MNAEVSIVHQSGFFTVRNFKCKCTTPSYSSTEYSKHFNISFVRKGNFTYKVFRNEFDAFTGYAIVDKPLCEYKVGHYHHIPDECTIIDFDNLFYNQVFEEEGLIKYSFFNTNNLQSALIKTSAEIEYLHYLLLNNNLICPNDELFIEGLVFEILNWAIACLKKELGGQQEPGKLKKNHLQTIEKAKYYISNNYMNNVSLSDIADYVNVSPFHFSRIFKVFTRLSPHKFLLNTRLKNSELLVRNTDMPIFDIAIDSGFNNLEHFSAAFKQNYQLSPIHYRRTIK